MKTKTLTSLFTLLFFSTLASAASISVDGKAKNPESIAYDKNTDSLYVSSFSDGAIVKINRTTSEVSEYQPAGFEGRTTAAGVKVDSANKHLWVIDGDNISIYDLTKTKEEVGYRLAQLKRSDVVQVAAPAQSFLNDVVIDSKGNGYVTDSNFPRLYKVTFSQDPNGGAKHFALSVQKDLTNSIPYSVVANVDGGTYNLNGIVLTPDEKALLAIKTNDGSLYRISLIDDKVEEVKLTDLTGAPTKLLDGDGLAWGGTTLFVIRNFINKISALNYVDNGQPQMVMELPIANLKTPTGAVVVGSNLYITNSQFKAAVPAAPFDVLNVTSEDH